MRTAAKALTATSSTESAAMVRLSLRLEPCMTLAITSRMIAPVWFRTPACRAWRARAMAWRNCRSCSVASGALPGGAVH